MSATITYSTPFEFAGDVRSTRAKSAAAPLASTAKLENFLTVRPIIALAFIRVPVRLKNEPPLRPTPAVPGADPRTPAPPDGTASSVDARFQAAEISPEQ